MDLNFLKWRILRGSSVARVVLRAFMFVLATTVVSFMQMTHEAGIVGRMVSNIDICPLNFGSSQDLNFTGLLKPTPSFMSSLFGTTPTPCVESQNFTKNVFKGLMEKQLLDSNAKALCVGEGSASTVLALQELGFSDAYGVDRHPFFSLVQRRFVYELNFEDNHFDFVFSRDLDRVSVPSLLVLEIERVLHPGGIGAILLGGRNFHSGGLVRLATPVVSFLKSSDVIYVCGVGSSTLVVFKKRYEIFSAFEHFQLPDNCPSVTTNKEFMKFMEPLADGKSGKFELEPSYLANVMNISSRNKLVYINIGAGEFAKESVAKLSKNYCSNHHAGFDVFVIDHRTSVLSSYVTGPGINFIYHPGLAGENAAREINSDEYFSAPPDDAGFDFIHWFNETVADGDFVVLMMNAKPVELNILVELFESGAICHVDELFLRCSNEEDCTTTTRGNRMSLFKSLRKSGVYVHQWLGN
ncbi:S-adenosyl-L-methionine-dependent methyltransferase [Forsythia ovata]|uniref:S-adenosyl-L-methionine-dependent methyltransferase n=1 Tax=Forsythia ovata TaxID=205694 RepID=A0ABD1RKY5_9LAMI